MGLYVIRHGETFGNVARVMDGRRESQLNDNGKRQASEACDKLKDVSFDMVFCSPLGRAIETMRIVTKERFPVTIAEDVIERSCGEFEGVPFETIDRDKYWDYYDDTKYISAESIKDLFDRVYVFLERIKKDYKDKNVLIVTHNGVTKAIRCYFEGIPEDGKLLNIGQANCEIKKYDWE